MVRVLDPDGPLPDYDDLPAGSVGGRSGWGLFGDDDQLGLINLLTPARVAAASRLVVTGRSFSLDLPLDAFTPPLNPRRGSPVHRVIAQPSLGFDDAWDNLFPQAGSQWDSLAHIGYTRTAFYNGRSADDVAAGRFNSIDRWSEHGITGRGIVLDVESVLRTRDPDYSAGTTVEFGIEELEIARRVAGIEYQSGDILLIHTGFTAWYLEQPREARQGLPGHLQAPGLEHSERICRYLWNTHVAAIASDTFAVEAWPAESGEHAQPFGFIHQMLIGSFGMALGELWWLRDLVLDCRADGVYEGMLVSSPLNAPGGISSPANAIFLK
jgi:kynurenine formamidase